MSAASATRVARVAAMFGELPPAARREAEAVVTQLYDATRPPPAPVSLGPVTLGPVSSAAPEKARPARKGKTMATIALTAAQREALWHAVRRGLFRVGGGYRARGATARISRATVATLMQKGLLTFGAIRGATAAVPTELGRRLVEEIG